MPNNPLDAAFMARALRLAERGLFTTSPNPRVGCVLVREGRVIGEGFHRRAGEAHAEILALRAAGPLARGATAYVTLEPCSHQGRTGPCCEALINAGIARLFYAHEDPNPQVSGRGAAALRQAGIQVQGGLMDSDARGLNAGFLRRMGGGLPWVTVKVAQGLDGCSALADGSSRWITGVAAREDAQRLRARSCVVITGSGTVLVDDPALTVRSEEVKAASPGGLRQPRRIVLDRRRRIGEHVARLQFFQVPGAEIAHDDNLRSLLEKLAGEGCNEVLVEAGPRLTGSFLAAGLVDALHIYLAPRLMGHSARSSIAAEFPDPLAEQPGWRLAEVRAVGSDLRLVYHPRHSGPG